jgi:hypothetical protein
MTSPNSAITEIVATTLRNRQRKFADNVSNHNALLKRLETKGNIKYTSGGRSILEEIEYAENSTAGFYSGYEAFDTTVQDVLSGAEFDWKQAVANIQFNGLESRIQNKGTEKMIDLVESRILNAEHSMKNLMAESIYSDGTGDGGKEIGGLALLIADDPTASSSIGGINQQTYTFWRNKKANTTLTTSNIYQYMNNVWLQTLRGADKPDLIMADSTLYSMYESVLQAQQRFTSGSSAMAGFESIKFKTADVVYDDNCPTTHMYFLNTDYLCLRVDPDTEYTVLPTRESINQDASLIPIVWAGNLTVSNRARQGVLYNS